MNIVEQKPVEQKFKELEQELIHKIKEIEQKADHRVSQVSSKSTRSMLFTLVIMVVGLVVVILFANRYINVTNNQLRDLDKTVKSLPSTPVVPREIEPSSALEIESLRSRLTSLETLQEAMVSTSRGALEQMNFVFTVVAAFFGLFSVFFAYRQIMADTSREGHDEEMRSLVGSFQNNITTISSLIITLEKSFEYRKEVERQLSKMDERAQSLEDSQQESDVVFRSLIADLNAEALKLFNANIDRSNLSLEETSRKLQNFANKMTGAGTTRQVENLLNPFCYYLRGLSNATIYQYESANIDFEIAHKKGRTDLVDPKWENYAEEDRENIDKRLKEILVSCSYFQGISYKNLGKYEESRKKFQEAIDRDSTHLQSKTYLLQIMYFDGNVPFEVIEKEYEKTIEEFKMLKDSSKINKEKIDKAFNTLKVNQGNMYLKKIISPHGFRVDDKKYEDQEKAIKYYWEAYDYLDDDLAAFSVAQAMVGVGSSAAHGKSPDDLYRKAMVSLKKRIAEDHDYLFSVMLYYMLAICARMLREARETSEFFLSQARNSLKPVPSHVTCFSPISKTRLTRLQILEEMELFERKF